MIPQYVYNAKVISVYDGDTITVEIDLGMSIKTTQKIRLYGIDTPELRGEEREEGLKVRDALRSLVLDKEVVLQTFKDKKGKYGRYLGKIYLGDVNINELLLERGWAVRYS